jgi:hypothetical protein
MIIIEASHYRLEAPLTLHSNARSWKKLFSTPNFRQYSHST